jgi:hypothetical protein
MRKFYQKCFGGAKSIKVFKRNKKKTHTHTKTKKKKKNQKNTHTNKSSLCPNLTGELTDTWCPRKLG